MPNFIGGIIQISLGAIVLATVYMGVLKGTNQTYNCHNGTAWVSCAWTASEIALWGVLGILGIMGLVYGVVQMFGMG